MKILNRLIGITIVIEADKSITIDGNEIKFKPLETSQEWFEFVLVDRVQV